MKIVSLTAENVKRLQAVFIKPNGNLVEITGKNGQGKTSVLDAIWWAITGTGSVQSKPIRNGEQRATIKLDLGEIIVTRTFTRKDETDYTTALSVRGADGSSFKSPQSVLDGLAGALAYDPLAFARAKSKDQFDQLRQFVPGIDFEKVDGQNRGDYERRTEANRMAREARAAANMISIPPDTPEQPIDEAALTTELKAAGTLNADVERRTLLRAQAAKDVEAHRERARAIIDSIDGAIAEIDVRFDSHVRGLKEQIAALQQQVQEAADQREKDRGELRAKRTSEAAAATAHATDLEDRLIAAEPLPDIIDVDAIENRLTEARQKNANVERARQRTVHLQTAERYEAESKALTESIEARNEAKRQAVAAAKMPVPGLDFGDGVVLLNGVPFDQASDAERLRASVAIAMAANPKLRVIRIRDGSLLDEDAMKLLAEMADANDMQVWIERVDSSGTVGFVLEDGHVRDTAAAGERSAA
jgi:DNA repair exonuclease SbcCD ATPase subunit